MHVTPLSTIPRTKEEKKQTNIWTDIDEIYNKNQALAPNFWGQLILMMM